MCCDSDYKITIFTSGNKVLLRLDEITGHMSPHAPLAIKRWLPVNSTTIYLLYVVYFKLHLYFSGWMGGGGGWGWGLGW